MSRDTLIVIHERRGRWARQLVPRLTGPAVRFRETRSRAELVASSMLSACPIALIDLGDDPARRIHDLDAFSRAAPTALTLVLGPGLTGPGNLLARELGATLVLSGAVVAPAVVLILRRWLPIARAREEAEGWIRPVAPDRPPEPPTKDPA